MSNYPLELLTASRQSAFRACQRLHYYSYTLGYRPVQVPSALQLGTAIGNALNVWWSNFSQPEEEQLRLTLDSVQLSDVYAQQKATVMLEGYHAVWRSEVSEVLFIEKEFVTPLVNPDTGARSRTFMLAGKMDKIVRLNDGRIAIVEHKTTSHSALPGSDYRRRLTLDGQISQYYEGADALVEKGELTEKPSIVLYDILVKPAVKPLEPSEKVRLKKDGTPYANVRMEKETPEAYRKRLYLKVLEEPGRYYQRAEIVRSSKERDEYRFDVWHIGWQIREARKSGYAPRNGDACFRYGPCPFLPVCEGTASLENTSLYRKSENMHEELSSDTQE